VLIGFDPERLFWIKAQQPEAQAMNAHIWIKSTALTNICTAQSMQTNKTETRDARYWICPIPIYFLSCAGILKNIFHFG